MTDSTCLVFDDKGVERSKRFDEISIFLHMLGLQVSLLADIPVDLNIVN